MNEPKLKPSYMHNAKTFNAGYLNTALIHREKIHNIYIYDAFFVGCGFGLAISILFFSLLK